MAGLLVHLGFDPRGGAATTLRLLAFGVHPRHVRLLVDLVQENLSSVRDLDRPELDPDLAGKGLVVNHLG
jgi:hypothetical protein